MSNNGSSPLVLWYNQLGMNDVDRVGGKNASLGEMITNLSGMGVSVPNGFATTADAFNQFLDQSGVNQRIYELLDKTDIIDTYVYRVGLNSMQYSFGTAIGLMKSVIAFILMMSANALAKKFTDSKIF